MFIRYNCLNLTMNERAILHFIFVLSGILIDYYELKTSIGECNSHTTYPLFRLVIY